MCVKSFVFWDVSAWNQVKVNQRFGGTCCLIFRVEAQQKMRMRQATKPHASSGGVVFLRSVGCLSPELTFYCDMTPKSRNSSLLGNGSVDAFPRKRTRATIEERCFLWSALPSLLRSGAVNTSLQQWINTQQYRKWCYLWGADPRLYNEDLTTRIRIDRVSGVGRIMARMELDWERRPHVWFEVTVRLLCIRCQDTTGHMCVISGY
jgi:hypothetical protein